MENMPDCYSEEIWHGCYSSNFDLLASESVAHPAKMAPGLCFRIFEHLKELGLLKEDSTVLDMLSGTGMTGLVAGALGLPSVMVELEEKFIAFQKQNREYLEKKLGREIDMTIIQGDARNLSQLITGINVAVTSPPYGETGIGDWQTPRYEFQEWVKRQLAEKGYIEWQGKRYSEAEWRDMNYGRLDGRVTKGVHKHPITGYSPNPENIGNLKDKPMIGITSPPYAGGAGHGGVPTELDAKKHITDWVKDQYGSTPGQIENLPDKPMVGITSPPYEAQSGGKGEASRNSTPDRKMIDRMAGSIVGGLGETEGQVGKEQGATYLSEMKQVYSEVAKVASVLVVITKNPTRSGKLRDLCGDTIRLLESTGWKLLCHHKALLFEETEQGHLFEGRVKKPRGRLSFFKRLAYQKGSVVADHEDILFAVREGEGAVL